MIDALTIAERYGRAVVSSHLRQQEGRCDLDYLTAAAWSDSLGAMLFRLRSEYDTARAVIDGTCEDTIVQRRAEAMKHLKGYSAARTAFEDLAETLAGKRGDILPVESRILARQVLQVWLDPLCHHCEGRGFTGGEHRGTPQAICRPCRGTGHRKDWIGESHAQRGFAKQLICDIDRHMSAFERKMNKLLRD